MKNLYSKKKAKNLVKERIEGLKVKRQF